MVHLRAGFVATIRAVALTAGRDAVKAMRQEWTAFGVVEVDQRLVEDAADLAIASGLRSLDALHLATALVLPRDDLLLLTWDRRLHAAATAEALQVVPEALD